MQPPSNLQGVNQSLQQGVMYGQAHSGGSQPAGFARQHFTDSQQGPPTTSRPEQQMAQPVYKSFPGYGAPDQRKAAFAPPYSQQGQKTGGQLSPNLLGAQSPQGFPSQQSPLGAQGFHSQQRPGDDRSGQSIFDRYDAGMGQIAQDRSSGQKQAQNDTAQQKFPLWSPGRGTSSQMGQQQNAQGLNGPQGKQSEAHSMVQQPQQRPFGQDAKTAGQSDGRFSNQQGALQASGMLSQGGHFGGLMSGGWPLEKKANGPPAGQNQGAQNNTQQPGGQSAEHFWRQLANDSFEQFLAQQGQSKASSTQPTNAAQQDKGGQNAQAYLPPWQNQQQAPSASVGLTSPTISRQPPGYSPRVAGSHGQAGNFQEGGATAQPQRGGQAGVQQSLGESKAPLLSAAELEGLHKLLEVSGKQQGTAVPAGSQSAPPQGQAPNEKGAQRGGASQASSVALSQPATAKAPEEKAKGPAVQQSPGQASVFNPYAMFQQKIVQPAPQSALQQSGATQERVGRLVKCETKPGPVGQQPPSSWVQQNGFAKQAPVSPTPGSRGQPSSRPQVPQQSNLPQGQSSQYGSVSQTPPSVAKLLPAQTQPQPNQNLFQQSHTKQSQFQQPQLNQGQPQKPQNTQSNSQQSHGERRQFQAPQVNQIQVQQAPQNQTQFQQPEASNPLIQQQTYNQGMQMAQNQNHQPFFQVPAQMRSQAPQSALGFSQQQFNQPQQQLNQMSPVPFQPQTNTNPALNQPSPPQFQQQMQGFGQQPMQGQMLPSFQSPQNQNDPERVRQQQRENAMVVLRQQELALQQRRAQQNVQGATKQAPQTPLTPLQQLAALRKKQEGETKQGGKPAQQQSLVSPPQQQSFGQTQLFGQPQVSSPTSQQQAFGGRSMGAPQTGVLTPPLQGQIRPPANVLNLPQAVPGQANLQTQSSGGQGVNFGQGGGFVQGSQPQAVGFGQNQQAGFVQNQGQRTGFGQNQGAGQMQGLSPRPLNVVGQSQGLPSNQGVSFVQRPVLIQQFQPQPQQGQTMLSPSGNQALNQMQARNQGVIQIQGGNQALQPSNQAPKPGFANPLVLTPQQMRPQFPTGGGFGMSPPMGMLNSPRFGGQQPRMPVVNANQPGVSGPRLGFQPSTAGSPRGPFQQGARRPGGGAAKAVDRTPLRCEPCDKDFVGREGYNAHLVSHEKCTEAGCNFEASGKVLKEHRYTAHKPNDKLGKAKAAAATNQESDEDIRKWREERRKHYPTETNVQKKIEDAAARRARGELEDVEAQRRRQRLREVLQQQKALGCPVAEIPPHILREDGGSKRPLEASDMLEGGAKRQAVEGGRICHFFLRGRCRKGRRCNFLHQRRPRGERGPGGPAGDQRQQNVGEKRAPTLLEKLLAPEIRKDKSYLLQSFRFMVNNNFFLEWPEEPLKFFEWTCDEEQEEARDEADEGGLEPMLDEDEGESDYESAGDEEEVE